MRLCLAVVLRATLILSPLPSVAQAEMDRMLDSVLAGRTDLFEDVDSADRGEDSSAHVTLDREWLPEFSAGFERRDLLGLHEPPGFLTYDRADGLRLMARATLPSRASTASRLMGSAAAGYAFGSHYWQAAADLSRDFFSVERPLRVQLEGHIITDTRDAWKVGAAENALLAAVAGLDAREYHERRGGSATIEQFIEPRTSVALDLRYDHYRNSTSEATWSLFGPSAPFRRLPPVTEGPIRSIALRLSSDCFTLRSSRQPRYGIGALFETGEGVGSIGAVDGGYSFRQIVIDGRGSVPIVDGWMTLTLHARFGSALGQAPPQRRFTLGGLGSLPGYPQNEFEGSRMVLLRTGLMVQPLRRGPLRSFRLILANDVGAVGSPEAEAAGIFAGLPSNARGYHHSVGLYLASATGMIRIGMAWRTDRRAPPTIVVRLSGS